MIAFLLSPSIPTQDLLVAVLRKKDYILESPVDATCHV